MACQNEKLRWQKKSRIMSWISCPSGSVSYWPNRLPPVGWIDSRKEGYHATTIYKIRLAHRLACTNWHYSGICRIMPQLINMICSDRMLMPEASFVWASVLGLCTGFQWHEKTLLKRTKYWESHHQSVKEKSNFCVLYFEPGFRIQSLIKPPPDICNYMEVNFF